MSDLYVAPSDIAGDGLFSKKKIRSGDIVVTSNSRLIYKINDGDFKFPDRIEYEDLVQRFKKYKHNNSNLTQYYQMIGSFNLHRANKDIKPNTEITKFYGLDVWLSILSGQIVANYLELKDGNVQKLTVTDPEKAIKILGKVAKKFKCEYNSQKYIDKIKIIRDSIITDLIQVICKDSVQEDKGETAIVATVPQEETNLTVE
jgi:hypothetical protein